jgi:Na+/melibiose symporter-like transporter
MEEDRFRRDPYRYEYKETPLSKAVLGALLTGIIATILNLIYDHVYRGITNYYFSEIFSLYALIAVTILICMAGGVVYFLLNKYTGKGTLIYIILVVILTVVSLFMHITARMPDGNAISSGVKGLKTGIDIITGCSAAFLVPYFAEHSKIWG